MTEAPEVAEPVEAVDHPWANLPTESHTLLRLAPLPTTPNQGARPLRFVEFGQLERHTADESLLRLSISVPGIRGQSILEFWVDHRNRSLRLGPEQGLLLSLPNRGLGRFLLAQAAAWAQQRWPHYRVAASPLSSLSSLDDSRMLRDQCLATQGLVVEYPEDPQIRPFCHAASVSALSTEWNAAKVEPVNLQQAAIMLEQANERILEQESEQRQTLERMSRLQQEDGTLRFSILCLITFSLFQAGLLIWIATR